MDMQQECKKTTIGGQALMEGLMMVGPEQTACAFRRKDGSILVEYREPLRTAQQSKIPIWRGARALFTQMLAGSRALMRSAELLEEDCKEEEKTGNKGEIRYGVSEEKEPQNFWKKMVFYASALLGLILGIALFVLLPNLVAGLFFHQAKEQLNGTSIFLYNCVEGAIRFALLLGYFYLTSKMKDIRQIWRYHGAEHKTIACYESGLPLTVENVLKQSRFHPRCGTSFLFLFVFLSIFLFSLVGWYAAWVNLLIRLCMVPLLAGLSYEVLRWSGKYDHLRLAQIVARPGLWVQRWTTAEPDAEICEVAIAAMKAVQPEDQDADRWT